MKTRLLVLIVFLAVIAHPALPQEASGPLGKDQVLDLVKFGLDSGELATRIKERGIDFEPTDDYLETLRTAGAQEAVIHALREARPKPLTREQVGKLVAGGVPSQRAVMLVNQHGIDFVADDRYLQTLRVAGGDDTLIAALHEASAAVTGELVVATLPDAEVYLEGELQGKADALGHFAVKAKPGAHALKVSLKGKKDFDQNITVAAPQTTKITAPLADLGGTVVVHTAPGAAVFVDDIGRGTTDANGHLTIAEVAAGSHELRVAASGKKEYREPVRVAAGQESAIEATLADIEWYLGTWSALWSNTSGVHSDQGKLVFSKTDSGDIESYGLQIDGTYGRNVFRGTILKPGEIRWEVYLDPRYGCCPSGWVPAISSEVGNDKRTMKILVPSQWASPSDSRRGSLQKPNTYVLTKISDSQSH